jgi:hypothetical protein
MIGQVCRRLVVHSTNCNLQGSRLAWRSCHTSDDMSQLSICHTVSHWPTRPTRFTMDDFHYRGDDLLFFDFSTTNLLSFAPLFYIHTCDSCRASRLVPTSVCLLPTTSSLVLHTATFSLPKAVNLFSCLTRRVL